MGALFCLVCFAAVACGSSESDGEEPREGSGGMVGAGGVTGGSAGALSTGGQVGGGASGGTSTGGQLGGGAPSETGGAAGSEKVPLGEIGNDVFSEDELKSYYLTFSEEELAKLMDLATLLPEPFTVNEDRYVRAELQVGETEVGAIGVRFKGNYSIWGCVDFVTKERAVRVEPFFGGVDVCQRFSLKLDFDRYDPQLRLDGLKKLNLHAMAADPSKMRERLGYSLFREAEIVAPRAVHARLYINGEYQGVVAAVEQVDGRFTAHRFGEAGDGNLYRDLWPSPDVSAADAEAALKTNDDPAQRDVSDFLAFAEAIAGSSEADFAARLEPFVDFEYLARYLVVDRAIGNYDGILAFYFGPGFGPENQNYDWYDVGSNRFTLIPWDLDKAFWYPEPNFWSHNSPHVYGGTPNWNVVTDGCEGYLSSFDATVVAEGIANQTSYRVREIDCDPFLRLLRGEIFERQAALAEAFIAGPFSEASIAAKLDAWRSQIAGAIDEDPLVDSAHWQASIDALEADIPSFQENLRLMMSELIDE